MEVISLTAPIELDSIRLAIESMMRKRAQGIFAIGGSEDVDSQDTIVESNIILVWNIFSTKVGYPNADLTELTYSTVAGRLEIDGLSTTGLPNNRRYWTSFGQLFEDVFFGRIPELLTAKLLLLDQNTNKIFWSDQEDGLDTNANTLSSILNATESKASSDFFE